MSIKTASRGTGGGVGAGLWPDMFGLLQSPQCQSHQINNSFIHLPHCCQSDPKAPWRRSERQKYKCSPERNSKGNEAAGHVTPLPAQSLCPLCASLDFLYLAHETFSKTLVEFFLQLGIVASSSIQSFSIRIRILPRRKFT